MPATKVAKSEDFMEWYNEVVELAELTDKRYPIKGMNIWRPFGQKIMSRIDNFTRNQMDRAGIDEVNFPLMIPEKLFMKEADQIKGFGGEVFWVDRAGNNPLPDGERWVIRPTSECAMYEVFPLWIRSHADLPLKTYQICNVFRYETKQTRAFMRVREIHFFEEHSVFATETEARNHVKTDMAIVGKVFENLALPTIQTRRPDWDKFPGAVESNAADIIMPSGKVLQCATVHYYGTNFAEAYDMGYAPLTTWLELMQQANPDLEGKWKATWSLTEVQHAAASKTTTDEDESENTVERNCTNLKLEIGNRKLRFYFCDNEAHEHDRSGKKFQDINAVGLLDNIATRRPVLEERIVAAVENPKQIELADETKLAVIPYFTKYLAHQTTYGMSERLVGAVVGCHGDDNGLMLPSTVAPVQIAIVPILKKGTQAEVIAYCEKVKARLQAAGHRVELDTRDRGPGDKYYHWELRGVPVRIEVGPRDIENESVFAARRDIPGRDGKSAIQLTELESGVAALLDAVDDGLRTRQAEFLADRIRRVNTLDEAKAIEATETLDVVYEMPISDDAAAQIVEKELDIKTLGVPIDADADATGLTCGATGAPATEWIRFARTY